MRDESGFYQDNYKLWHYIQYNQFSIGSASQVIHWLLEGLLEEVATDYWFNQQRDQRYLLNGIKLSTQDNDNDQSAWW